MSMSSGATTAPSVSTSVVTSPTATATLPAGNQLRLSHPTALVNATAATSYINETEVILDLPFLFSLYAKNGTYVTITTNGLVSIGGLDTRGNPVVPEDHTDNNPTMTLEDTFELTSGTAAVWWEFLQAAPGTQQGIYYQIDGTAGSPTETLSVEWYLENADGQMSDFIAQYFVSQPGNITYYYFTNGDGGVNATVGVVGNDFNGEYQVAQYESATQGDLFAGLRIAFDTNLTDTGVGTFTPTDFDPTCVPPGTWPQGVCPGTPVAPIAGN
ncbi:hypothetical protein MMC25_004651 [Agyrium rufum]|nr:hypothetical protein [Agyrium rufum]